METLSIKKLLYERKKKMHTDLTTPIEIVNCHEENLGKHLYVPYGHVSTYSKFLVLI